MTRQLIDEWVVYALEHKGDRLPPEPKTKAQTAEDSALSSLGEAIGDILGQVDHGASAADVGDIIFVVLREVDRIPGMTFDPHPDAPFCYLVEAMDTARERDWRADA